MTNIVDVSTPPSLKGQAILTLDRQCLIHLDAVLSARSDLLSREIRDKLARALQSLEQRESKRQD